jgi:hypothetical protein
MGSVFCFHLNKSKFISRLDATSHPSVSHERRFSDVQTDSGLSQCYKQITAGIKEFPG